MKYRIIKTNDDIIDLIVEDGGVATLHHNGKHFVITCYQKRLTECDPTADSIWDELAEGKVYVEEWEDRDPSEEEFESSALEWLVFPAPIEGFERDDSIFLDFSF